MVFKNSLPFLYFLELRSNNALNSFRQNMSPKSKENNRKANNEAQKRRRAKMNEETHENVCAKDNARHRIKRYL